MRKQTRCFALGGLWLGVAVLQIYHLHTGEFEWSWSSVLALLVFALGACYYFVAALKSADGSPSRVRDAE